jgi:hypothetical protein
MKSDSHRDHSAAARPASGVINVSGAKPSAAQHLPGSQTEVRPVAVLLAQAKIADPNYPGPAVLEKIAQHLARQWFQTDAG